MIQIQLAPQSYHLSKHTTTVQERSKTFLTCHFLRDTNFFRASVLMAFPLLSICTINIQHNFKKKQSSTGIWLISSYGTHWTVFFFYLEPGVSETFLSIRSPKTNWGKIQISAQVSHYQEKVNVLS